MIGVGLAYIVLHRELPSYN